MRQLVAAGVSNPRYRVYGFLHWVGGTGQPMQANHGYRLGVSGL